MTIERFQNDTIDLIISVTIDGEKITDFTGYADFTLHAKVDDTTKSITSTTFDNVESTITFDTSGTNAEIFDTVTTTDCVLIATTTSGKEQTFDVGQLIVKYRLGI